MAGEVTWLRHKLRRVFSPKSPAWPALWSALIAPGAGQLFNRDFKRGAFFLLAFFSSLFLFLKVVGEKLSLLLLGTPDQWERNPEALKKALTQTVHEAPGFFLTFQLMMIVIWISSIVDAYYSAKTKQREPKQHLPSDQ